MTHAVRPKSVHRLAVLTMIAISLCMVAGGRQAPAQPTELNGQLRACPTGYALINHEPAYCFSRAGDVVEPMAIYRPASAAGCRRGYERLDELCISPATGDVELAEMPAGTQSSR